MTLVAKGYVCVAVFASPDLYNRMVGVYESKELAIKRVGELRAIGLLGECDVEYYDEVLWGE